MLHIIYLIFKPLYLGGLWFRNHFSPFGTTIFYCALFAAIIGLDAKSNLSSMIFSFGCSIFLLCFIFCLFFRPKILVKRNLPEFATVGEKLVYSIDLERIEKSNALGLYVSEKFRQPYPKYHQFRNSYAPANISSNSFDRVIGYYKWIWVLRNLRGGDSARTEIKYAHTHKIKLSFTPIRRGIINMEGIQLYRPDPFGLCFATKTITHSDSILVLPKRYKVPHIALPGTSPMHQPGGIPFTSSIGESDEFSSLREYRPGDSFRGIHWKSWAKTGKPIVKETHPEFFIRNALVLDTIVPTEMHDIFEEAVAVATSFLCTIDTQESLLDLIFVGDKPYNFTSGRGLSSPASTLKILACAQMASDKNFDSLACAVLKNSYLFSGCILILCDFDDNRRRLHNNLLQSKIKLLTLVISVNEIPDCPHDVLQLDPNNIQDGLDKL
ncbi:MAG: DUF58 domain-containing protein [Gammaproteobacteria bacterium]|nr:MAG: DUF58 domain-containing protein [Gammaproteobacteria bacterium]